jgi:hypothetical protein
VISNPFAGIAPIPMNVPSDPLSGLMAMEAEELEIQMDGRVGVEQVCGEGLEDIQIIRDTLGGRFFWQVSTGVNPTKL